MPTLEFAGLMTAYVVIAMLLLSLNLYSRWNWWIKILTNIVVASFFWVTYLSFPQLLGWPTTHGLPKRFYLHAINIDEPRTVYIWGTGLDRGLGRAVPRAFALPYSKALHEQSDIAARKLRKGLPVVGQINITAAAIDQQTEATAQSQARDIDVTFVDAPQALIPGKQ